MIICKKALWEMAGFCFFLIALRFFYSPVFFEVFLLGHVPGMFKGIFFNKLDSYKIIQFLFDPTSLISLLLVIAIALILSISNMRTRLD